MDNQPTAGDIFRRALEIRQSNPNVSYKDIKLQIVNEFNGRAFARTYNVTIPDLDDIGPEEDWTAGLSLVFRGIQTED